MRKSFPATSKFLLLVCGLIFMPIGLHAYTGLFSRYLADDYCTASTLRNLGFFGSQIDWYNNWSGRFSFTFTINLTQIVGPGLTPFLTTILLILWLATLSYTINWIIRRLGWRSSLLFSFLLSELILYSVLESTPDIYQSLYWQTGIITYALPLMLFTAFVGWFSYRSVDPIQGVSGAGTLAISGLLAFIAGGFSETFATMQTTSLVVLLVLILFFGRKNRDPRYGLIISGLMGSIAAMVVIIAAPGNAIRQSLMPSSPDIFNLVGWSVRHALAFSAKSVLEAPAPFLISFVLPFSLVLLRPTYLERHQESNRGVGQRWKYALVGIPIVVYLLIVSSIVPSVYATSAYPAERALITSQYALTIGIIIWGICAGIAIRDQNRFRLTWNNTSRAIVIGLLGLSIIISAQKRLTLIPQAHNFAQLWDQRDQELRLAFQNGLIETSAMSLPHMGGLAEIGKDPAEWINLCVASSYGLVKVAAKE